MGNRIAKYVYDGTELESSTFYVRDAQGTTIAVYDEKVTIEEIAGVNTPTLKYALAERHIYGSSRLGMDTTEVVIPVNATLTVEPTAETNVSRYLGKRLYELSNHLGNVLTVISDRKMAVPAASSTEFWYYRPHIVSVTDYSPFGVALTARTWSDQEYRYGFNGKDRESEFSSGAYDFGARIHDARLGRWMSVDPDYHLSHFSSPYVSFANNPLIFVDPGGNHNIIYLIILPGARKGILTKVFYRLVAKRATEFFKTLGLKTEVKVYEGKPEDFVMNDLDKTDAVYVIGGSVTEIEKYAAKELDPFGTAVIMEKDTETEWKGGADNPEKTENYGILGKNGEPIFGGDLAFIDVSQILQVARNLGLVKDFKTLKEHISEVEQALGIIILHAGGHSCGLSHNEGNESSNNGSALMQDYEDLGRAIGSGGIYSVLNKIDSRYDSRTNVYKDVHVNADYIAAMIRRFKANEIPIDNYAKKHPK